MVFKDGILSPYILHRDHSDLPMIFQCFNTRYRRVKLQMLAGRLLIIVCHFTHRLDLLWTSTRNLMIPACSMSWRNPFQICSLFVTYETVWLRFKTLILNIDTTHFWVHCWCLIVVSSNIFLASWLADDFRICLVHNLHTSCLVVLIFISTLFFGRWVMLALIGTWNHFW